MREILTNATFFFQYLEYRRGDCGRFRIELEFGVDQAHQGLHGFEQLSLIHI